MSNDKIATVTELSIEVAEIGKRWAEEADAFLRRNNHSRESLAVLFAVTVQMVRVFIADDDDKGREMAAQMIMKKGVDLQLNITQ